MRYNLKLYFSTSGGFYLNEVQCSDFIGNKYLAIRGRESRALAFAKTFTWSAGVKSLSYFFLRTKYQYDILGNHFILFGKKGSDAARLAFLAKKDLIWTSDMFGVDLEGHSQIRQILKLNNPYFKLGDEVAVSLDFNFLRPEDIQIYLDNQIVNTFSIRRMIAELKNRKIERDEIFNETFQRYSKYSQCCT